MESRLAISNMKRVKKLEKENKKLKEDVAYLMKNKADRASDKNKISAPPVRFYANLVLHPPITW